MDTETHLLLRLSGGDENALRELYDQLRSRVYTLALEMLKNPQDAEEVLQDTFVKLYHHAREFRPQIHAPKAFIYTIARHECLNRIRAREARPVNAGLDLSEHDHLASVPFSHPENRITVDHAMHHLNELDQHLIHDSFFQGYTHDELSSRYRLPLGTIKTRLRRALSAMKKALEGK
ncbi:RNA polymerase sigma factor [Deinococcus roseus]|uniref:RNA polymerase sigma factor n=1 Tax=Deinococcus roseus TaxID=392414 RepID=A0ABQ2DJU3_9DEIO|nr:sigma-70 family RNA polymerase sigma factor [Deinococcus roseus]GGJ59995.1 RNA polymerase sigma factor [Deinococcus roseus]